MSAWIVFPEHISYLVQGALELAPDGFLPYGESGKLLTPETKDQIGHLLMDENVRSVSYRYDRDFFEDLPGPVDKSGVREYRHLPLDLTYDPIVFLKQLACYEYQSCEHPEWPESDACAFCEELCALAEATLPPDLRQLAQSQWTSERRLIPAYLNTDAYDEAAWGIGPEHRLDCEAV